MKKSKFLKKSLAMLQICGGCTYQTMKRQAELDITNGTARSGYIPNDAAYGFQTFEVLSSRLKPGYAESAIVNGLLDLINEATH